MIRMEQGMGLREGIPWPLPGQGHDTLIAYRITDRGVGPKELCGLKPLRAHWLPDCGYAADKDGADDWLKARGLKPGQDIWHLPVDMCGFYGAGDSCSTLELWEQVKGMVYRPWRWPDEFGWWWERGYFDLKDPVELADLYDLEIETAYQALIASQHGTRFDINIAARRADGAVRLQRACDEWVKAYIERLDGDMSWVWLDDAGKGKLNPGSVTQIKRLLFGDGADQRGLGLQVDTRYMSKSFADMTNTAQEKILADPTKTLKYAALTIDAMKDYTDAYPQYRDLLSVVGARRKMTTVLQWAQRVPERYAMRSVGSAWWRESADDIPTHRVYHQVGTVQTVSGRMSSSAYNGTNVSADKALRIPGARNGTTSVIDLLRQHHGDAYIRDMLRSIDVTKDGGMDFGIRCEFLTDEGCNGRTIDLSQIEVRIFAGLTGNEMLCKGYGPAPAEAQVSTELRLLRAMGEGTLDVDGYLRQCVLDPMRHWSGTPIDAHSLVTSMTTFDADVRETGLDRATYDDVLQLAASDEDRATLRILEGWRRWSGGCCVRELRREDMALLMAGVDAADRGDAAALLKSLTSARKSKKRVTFGIMYGMGVPKLARSLGLSIDDTKAFLAEKYYAALPQAKSLPWKIEDQIVRRATAENNYVGWMRHPAGRRFKFEVTYGHKPWRTQNCPTGSKGQRPGPRVRKCSECVLQAKGAYVAVNRFIQGYAAALFKMGFTRAAQLLTTPTFGGGSVDQITRRRYGPNRIDREIHDENIAMLHREYDDARTDFALRSAMTLANRVGVPLQSSSGRFKRDWSGIEEVVYSSLHEK